MSPCSSFSCTVAIKSVPCEILLGAVLQAGFYASVYVVRGLAYCEDFCKHVDQRFLSICVHSRSLYLESGKAVFGFVVQTQSCLLLERELGSCLLYKSILHWSVPELWQPCMHSLVCKVYTTVTMC